MAAAVTEQPAAVEAEVVNRIPHSETVTSLIKSQRVQPLIVFLNLSNLIASLSTPMLMHGELLQIMDKLVSKPSVQAKVLRISERSWMLKKKKTVRLISTNACMCHFWNSLDASSLP